MRLIIFLLINCLIISCAPTDNSKQESNQDNTELIEEPTNKENKLLTRVSEEATYELGMPCGYINAQGDTIIPMGRYGLCWSETIESFGIVWDESVDPPSFKGINAKGEELYEILTFDNGPDQIQDGLFRIRQNGKVGFADESGAIKIQPQYACAFPFEGGKAKVANNCSVVPDGEYQRMESEEWFYVNTAGEKVEE